MYMIVINVVSKKLYSLLHDNLIISDISNKNNHELIKLKFKKNVTMTTNLSMLIKLTHAILTLSI